MIARVEVAGRRGTIEIDPEAAGPYQAVRSDDLVLEQVVASRLADAAERGTELSPTGPVWRHRTLPWRDDRELAIALATLLADDDPLVELWRRDADIRAMLTVPTGVRA